MDYINTLIERLRKYSQPLVAYKLDADFADACAEAADKLEKLQAKLDRVTRERNAAVEDLRVASIEGYMDCNWCAGKTDQTQCYNCSFANNWKWRGTMEG